MRESLAPWLGGATAGAPGTRRRGHPRSVRPGVRTAHRDTRAAGL